MHGASARSMPDLDPKVRFFLASLVCLCSFMPFAQVLPTSNRTALIEMVPNAPSIHALKSKSPPGTRWEPATGLADALQL